MSPFMNWIAATLASALFLGCYDLCTKHAVHENAVLPVLFLANVCSATIWLTLLGLQRLAPTLLPDIFAVPHLTLFQHAQLALKSVIVAASWLCTYFAVKHLPVSIASPVRATGPVWTLAGALLILAERPTLLQMAGIVTTLASFILLSVAGRGEGVHFHRNKWIWWLVAGTILGAVSGLYDKYLLGRRGFAASTVQAWFAIYLALLFLPAAVGWKFRWWTRNEFHWRWSIPFLSITLLTADFLYFGALRNPMALIALVASLRRGSVLVGFAGGLLFFGERSNWQKWIAVFGIVGGIILAVF
jgi:bacterial/archaeal transporter family protein